MAVSFRPFALSFAASIGIVAAVPLASTAQAADRKAASAPSGTKSPLLTPAQLRDCVERKEKLTRNTEAVVKARAAIEVEDAQIAGAGTSLTEQDATLDRTDAEAVAAYNAKALERNARIEPHRAAIAAHNRDAEAVLSEKEAYERACANRRYDDRDLRDLQRKK